MFKTLFLTLTLLLTFSVSASDKIFRIEIGKDYKEYSNQDLQRRVWELERAVAQLQMKVFELSMNQAAPSAPTPVAAAEVWSCTISAMNNNFVASGATKAVALTRVMDKCKSGSSNAFFCDHAECSKDD